MDAATLLEMGTVNGARALGMDADAFQIRPGVTLAGLVGVPVERPDAASGSLAAAVLRSDALPELLFHSNRPPAARD
jgi:cytosine/adenosine deaminase-related metal-dependent hydrolase